MIYPKGTWKVERLEDDYFIIVSSEDYYTEWRDDSGDLRMWETQQQALEQIKQIEEPA